MINSNETVLEVRDLTYKYHNGTVAIENINMQINRGEKVAVIGSNGAGKSTLLSHFNGLKEPTSGEILIEGQKMEYDKPSLMKIRQKVGVVFQNSSNQLFAPTVIEDVAFGPRIIEGRWNGRIRGDDSPPSQWRSAEKNSYCGNYCNAS